jgi:hypothetical protein
MWIRLTRKLADFLDGVDVSTRQVGEVFELPVLQAHLLIAEGWAEAHTPTVVRGRFGAADGADARTASSAAWLRVDFSQNRLRQMRAQMTRRLFVDQERRRAEDRIREELHDAHARTIKSG